jgi:hypothetical protein
VRSGRSAALPNLCARQSHDREGELDSTHASAKDCGNRASWCLVWFAPPSYQEALLSCADSRAITRSETLFEQASPVIDKRMASHLSTGQTLSMAS